jgi:hypothetical protein
MNIRSAVQFILSLSVQTDGALQGKNDAWKDELNFYFADYDDVDKLLGPTMSVKFIQGLTDYFSILNIKMVLWT